MNVADVSEAAFPGPRCMVDVCVRGFVLRCRSISAAGGHATSASTVKLWLKVLQRCRRASKITMVPRYVELSGSGNDTAGYCVWHELLFK